MTEEPNWTPYLDAKTSDELFVRMFQAELDQIEIEDGENCRMIKVRGVLVGAVDHETEVSLQLGTENSPALKFRRKGTGMWSMVFLHEWER